MSSLVALPHRRALWLHALDGSEITPVTKLAESSAKVAISSDLQWIATLEKKHRVSNLLQPHEDCVTPVGGPIPLPRGVTGHAVSVVDGVLFVGGGGERSRDGLWLRTADRDWVPVQLPPGLGVPGKAIDGLLRTGDRLIAVDDIVMPKFSVIYDIRVPHEPRLINMIELPAHTSYEQVVATAINGDWVALLSKGINHGIISTHVALLDPETLAEKHLDSGWSDPMRGSDDPNSRESKLSGARDLCMTERHVVVAAGEAGYFVANVHELKRAKKSGRGQRRPFLHLRQPSDLRAVVRVTTSTGSQCDAFLIGPSTRGQLSWEKVDLSDSAEWKGNL